MQFLALNDFSLSKNVGYHSYPDGARYFNFWVIDTEEFAVKSDRSVLTIPKQDIVERAPARRVFGA